MLSLRLCLMCSLSLRMLWLSFDTSMLVSDFGVFGGGLVSQRCELNASRVSVGRLKDPLCIPIIRSDMVKTDSLLRWGRVVVIQSGVHARSALYRRYGRSDSRAHMLMVLKAGHIVHHLSRNSRVLGSLFRMLGKSRPLSSRCT